MPDRHVKIFSEICEVVAESRSPRQTLEAIVERVAHRFATDVCSVYLFDANRDHLVLKATVGLRPDAVDTVRMATGEGLTGLVIETGAPVFVQDPDRHPRYKYFAESGEEAFRTFLAVPLVYLRETLGVLVVQTRDPAAVSEEDVPTFVAIASQIAATVAYSGLLKALQREQDARMAPGDGDEGPLTTIRSAPASMKSLLRGVPASAGIAEGTIHFLAESVDFDQVHCAPAAIDPEQEIRRLRSALSGSLQEVDRVRQQVQEMSPADRAILEAHRMYLQDRSFEAHIARRIRRGDCAEFALKSVVADYAARFQEMEHPYLRERSGDIEDVGRRILRHLMGIKDRSKKINFSQPAVLVAADLSPVDLLAIRQPHLKGIVLSRGGRTSHTVILAKSFEIPMVIGLQEALESLRINDRVIMDGTSGLVFRNPPKIIVSEYAHLTAEKEKTDQQLSGLRGRRAETLDGQAVALGANIGLLSDLALVDKYGADHIGLYRTEFPFLARKDFPSEEEQVTLYRKIIEGAGGRTVTLRTLDVGGDKFLSYLDNPRERNPYLGWRSIRVSLDLDTVFRSQVRAVLRASAHGPVRLLFPMITAVEEMRRVAEIVEMEKKRLRHRGAPFDPSIPVGFMVEVPGAVPILEHLLAYADFASIGTNDLIQYVLAVDRNNDKVAHLYDPLHPAVIATIFDVITRCRKARKPVSVCGEAAANPLCAYLYVAMGVDGLSMAPAAIPLVKHLVCHISGGRARQVLKSVMPMASARAVADDIEERIRKLLPG